MGADDLHQIGADEGQRDGDFERAEEFRQRFGQGDFPEHRQVRGAERAQDVAVFRLQRRKADETDTAMGKKEIMKAIRIVLKLCSPTKISATMGTTVALWGSR